MPDLGTAFLSTLALAVLGAGLAASVASWHGWGRHRP